MRTLATLFLLVSVGCAAYVLVLAHAPLPPMAMIARAPVEEAPVEPPPAPPAAPEPVAVEPSPPAEPVVAAEPVEPKSSATMAREAWRAVDDSDWDRAGVLALDCIARDPRASECRNALVASFMRRDRWDEAHSHLLDWYAADPTDPRCLAALKLFELRSH